MTDMTNERLSLRDRWAVRRILWRLNVNRHLDRLLFAVVCRLPHRVVYLCAIRVVANATCGPFSGVEAPSLRAMDALGHWEKREGGDRSFDDRGDAR